MQGMKGEEKSEAQAKDHDSHSQTIS